MLGPGPFHHLEPGSWHSLLGLETWRIDDGKWARLVAASRAAAKRDGSGFFDVVVVRLLKPQAKRAWLEEQVRKLEPYGPLSTAE